MTGVSIALFRVFQESLTNVIRHSEAGSMGGLIEKTDAVTAAVTDNRVGITENALAKIIRTDRHAGGSCLGGEHPCF
ncbi:MAG: hypothetical protein R2861_03840 [Desulfobacterales bacterium]